MKSEMVRQNRAMAQTVRRVLERSRKTYEEQKDTMSDEVRRETEAMIARQEEALKALEG